MNQWLAIALVAYLIGALIEGLHVSNQLSHSLPEATQGSEDAPKTSQTSETGRWHYFLAVTTVSICGAFSWPCRLIHGAIKKGQPQPRD